MTSFAFRRDSGEFGCDAWRPLDRAVYRWVITHQGSAVLARTAAWASLADGQGDSALPLTAEGRHGMPPLTAPELEQLRAEPMVAHHGEGRRVPFVLDDAGRFYLHRNHANECRVAALLQVRRSDVEAAWVDEVDLDVLFGGDRSEAVQPQRLAVRNVVGRRLFVLTGGPGSGKTTTVLRMLAMLQKHSATPLAMAAAAPTGKAAQRLVEALRRGRQRLLDGEGAPLPAEWRAVIESLQDSDALTLHRLLGFDPQRNGFRRNAAHPLAEDVIVVDEASMVDLSMLRALLEAVRPEATLILVGDADQLTSVATGSVLMDLVGVFEREAGYDLVRLRHSFRAEQALVAVNEAVRAGDGARFAASCTAAGAQVLRRRIDDPAQLATQVRAWSERIANLEGLRPVLPDDADDAAARSLGLAALDVLAAQQLLCALREDTFGSLALNRIVERHLRRAWRHAEGTEWYPGRAVIVTRNDHAVRLFNGDVGLCLADAAGRLQVWFETVDANGDRSVRGIAPGALPPHEPAFAITIHKSQGSEYAHVAVVLPPDAESRILSRQLLYTGLSRARRTLELWSSDAALEAALARPADRSGGLADRLAAGRPHEPPEDRVHVPGPRSSEPAAIPVQGELAL
ncbi:exodeoxyribonuclease V subunit alpha [Lysobacter korlensis]|uniref:RecBCD enzyme subunit RecD n=1 Tax=Lysobacter korlensis TaxID=553636 RepID=A0ABV6RR60_9GAMM